MDTQDKEREIEIDRLIESFTPEERKAIVDEATEKTKINIINLKKSVPVLLILGAVILALDLVIIIYMAVSGNWYAEAPIGFAVFGGALILVAVFWKYAKYEPEKETFRNIVIQRLNIKDKFYVERLTAIKAEYAVPYADFQLARAVELRKLKFEYLLIDDENSTFVIKKCFDYSRKYSFNEIAGYQVLENGISAQENAATGALVGGIIETTLGVPGGALAGAVLGGKETCNSMQVVIMLNNLAEPTIFLDLLGGSVAKNSIAYTSAQKKVAEITSIIQYMMNKNKA